MVEVEHCPGNAPAAPQSVAKLDCGLGFKAIPYVGLTDLDGQGQRLDVAGWLHFQPLCRCHMMSLLEE